MRKAGMTSELSTMPQGSMAENPWYGNKSCLSVFEGLSFGHGTKFNWVQIDVNYKVTDLM